MSNNKEKVDIPEPNDTASVFLKSLTKTSIVVIGYVLLIIITYVLHMLFGGSNVFILLYIFTLLLIMAGIGSINSYIFSNILTGLSLGFGFQMMFPMQMVTIMSNGLSKKTI
jgi:hypothetical protein